MVNTYSKKKDGNKQLSANFKVREFACKCGRCDEVLVDSALVAFLQRIRDHFGKPIHVNSGHRCEDHNIAVGGASDSRHVRGMAADIRVEGVKPAEVAKYAESIGVLGIGLYDDFVHIDTRDYKSFWYGHQQEHRDTFGGYGLKSFVRDVQASCGAAVDGIAGPETISKTVTLSEGKNACHAAVKAVQQRLYALGYTMVGTADGIAGRKFTAAVKEFQKDNGCWVDGIITARNKTWRKLLGMEGSA